MTSLPLEGIRILEVGSVFVLPLAITPLAGMGAEVIKIEALFRPDTTRFAPQLNNAKRERSWNHGGHYQELNRNKLSLTLNLQDPEGVRIFKELVKLSDIVAENFTPRVMKNLDLDYEVLRTINPSIIMLSSSGYGHSGPWMNYSAWGPNTEAVAGLMQVTGYPDGRPLRVGAGGLGGVAYNDVVGAYYGAFSIMGALEYRDRTGKGQWIDLSHYEAGATIISEAIMDYLMTGNVAGRAGNRHEYMAPHGCYRSQGEDKWVTIAVASDEEWERFCHVLGNPAWAEDERFATTFGRWRHQDEINLHIEEWTRERDNREVMRIMQEAGLAAGAVLSSKEVHADPHMNERGAFVSVPHAENAEEMGEFRHLGMWWQMSKTPGDLRQPAATLGQHNEQILSGLLGMSPEDLQRLAESGIIGTEPVGKAANDTGVLPLEIYHETGRLKEIDPKFRAYLRNL